MSELNSNIESTLKAAKASNTVLKNKTKNESLTTLKQARDLMLKFNHCDNERTELLASYIEPEPVEDPTVELPTIKELPDKPELLDAKKAGSHWVLLIICLLLAGACYFGGNYYLIPNGLYTQQLMVELSNIYLSEFEVGALAFITIGILLFVVLDIKNTSSYHKKLDENKVIMDDYAKECKAIKEENDIQNDEYQARLADAKKIADEERAKRTADADETNTLLNLKVESVSTTMRHLQDQYMALYHKQIPNEYADIDKLNELIHILEINDDVLTINDAIKIASAN